MAALHDVMGGSSLCGARGEYVERAVRPSRKIAMFYVISSERLASFAAPQWRNIYVATRQKEPFTGRLNAWLHVRCVVR
jgi:hypothetical protein